MYMMSSRSLYKQLLKRRHIPVVGVKLWNDTSISLHMCNSLLVFKRMVYNVFSAPCVRDFVLLVITCFWS